MSASLNFMGIILNELVEVMVKVESINYLFWTLILTDLIYCYLHCNDFHLQDPIGYFLSIQAVLDDKYNADRQVAGATMQ